MPSYVIKQCDKTHKKCGSYFDADHGKYIKDINKATTYQVKDEDYLTPGDKFVKVTVTIEEI
jgi:hypothetical protein